MVGVRLEHEDNLVGGIRKRALPLSGSGGGEAALEHAPASKQMRFESR